MKTLKNKSKRIFDAEWYLRQNPDVTKSAKDPYGHFLLLGNAEGRQPKSDPFVQRNIKQPNLFCERDLLRNYFARRVLSLS